jgi:hypothetical protein
MLPAQRVLNDLWRTMNSCGRKIRLLAYPLPSASCLSFSVFLRVVELPAVELPVGRGGDGVGEKRNHDTTARKPGPLKIIQYSLCLHACLQPSACLSVCYLYVQCLPIVFSLLCPPPLSLFSILYCTVLVCLSIFLLSLLIDCLHD